MEIIKNMMESKVVFTDIKDDVAEIINETTEKHLKLKMYSAADVQGWTNAITSEITSKLKEVSTNFKYIVTCAIMQKCEGGLHVASTCYWSTSTDGNCAFKWENETLYCIINVYALAQ